jgi:phospholipid/cholesterol/gamma-HCH transport system permease protein
VSVSGTDDVVPARADESPARPAATSVGAVRAVTEIGGMVRFTGRVLGTAVRRPWGFWGSSAEAMYQVLARAWLPMVLAVFTFSLMIGVLGLNFLDLLGAGYRYGQYFFIVNTRDFTPWINSMIVAGIVGTASCADLGARTVREEIDALVVLGINPLRELVLPRIVALTVLTPLLMVVSLAMGIVGGLFSSVFYGDVPSTDYWAPLFKNLTAIEIGLAVAKSLIIGFVTGVVCVYKGLSVQGSSAGVGRAVNEAVVIAFVLVFVTDFVLNLTALGLFPQLGSVR